MPPQHARATSSALKLRIASALVLAPPALAAVWFGEPWLAILVVLAVIGMGREWARLSGGAAFSIQGAVIITGLAATLAMWWGAGTLALLIALLGSAAVWGVARRAKAAAPLWIAGGTLWITLPSVAILWIGVGENGRLVILFLLAVVWASDIAAYVAGRAIGGPRLAPALSPNKTWAGALGGLLGVGVVALAAAVLLGWPIFGTVAIGLLLAVAAQLGDLAESLAKRRFGVKDSGSLIPGHGGILDRLDSLLTASCVAGAVLLLGAGGVFGWRL